jgi:hypothetical protein
VIADVGITTPKQMAKTMVKFSVRHSELEFSRYVIPQVPGTEARSAAVHGVVESFLKSKKYIVPSAVASPIFAGCVVAVYEGTGTGRFKPAQEALVYNPQRELEVPVGEEDRRSFQLELNHLVAAEAAESGTTTRVQKTLGREMVSTTPGFDSAGRPVLRVDMGDRVMSVGLTAGNIFAKDSSWQFAQQVLEARLQDELRRGNPPKASESDIEHDWNLLQKAMKTADNEVAAVPVKALQAGASR